MEKFFSAEDKKTVQVELKNMAVGLIIDHDSPEEKRDLAVLEGDIPSPVNPPKGCKFHTRCKYCTEICTHVVPDWEEVTPNHFVACHHKLHTNE